MRSTDPQTVTRLLDGVRAGNEGSEESLLPLIYDELRALAQAQFSNERRGHTLQPTALIHEAWFKVSGHLAQRSEGVEDRRHFFALASRAMRQVLADHARACRTWKRGEGRRPVTLLQDLVSVRDPGVDLVDLDDSLTRLAELNDRHARVVELRVLGGLTIAETARALDVSHTTVESDWFMARAWLRKELGCVG